MYDGVCTATFLEILYRMFFSYFYKVWENLPKMPNSAGYMFLKLENIMVILPKKIQSLFNIFVFLM